MAVLNRVGVMLRSLVGKISFFMKILLVSIFLSIAIGLPAFASESDNETFAQEYFHAWVTSQSPDAEMSNIEAYLALLTEDIGHQHLPYDSDDSRSANNKENMREGMKFYLGAHTRFKADLISVSAGHNVVVLKYSTESEGVRPQTGELITQEYDTIEVLELEDSRVSVIRKYSE